MGLLIDGKKIIPAPLVTLTKNEARSGDGRPISTTFQINLRGSLLPNNGSPNSSGIWQTGIGYPNSENFSSDLDKFNSILAKQEYLKEVLNTPGKILEYGPDNGSPAVIANIRLQNLTFQPGQWVDKCDYDIVLDAHAQERQDSSSDQNYGEFNDKYIVSANNSIQITQTDDGLNNYSIVQSISAVGFTAYDNPDSFINTKQPWENAKDWVVSKISDPVVGYILDTTGKTRYNKKTQESIDKLAGSYSLTIEYTITENDDNFINNYEITTQSIRSQIDDLNIGQSLQDTYTITGTIIGLDENRNQSERISAALNALNDFESTIPTILGLNSSHKYASKNISKNYQTGSISYTFTYNNYPSANYTHTYNVADNKNSSNLSTVTISGNIQAFTENGDVSNLFSNAETAWNTVKNQLYTLATDVVGNIINNVPSNITLGFNKSTGLVTYSATYNYLDETNSLGSEFLDQFDVTVNEPNIGDPNSRSKQANATINGQIIGYDQSGLTLNKYTNAINRYNQIKSTIKDRVAAILGITLKNKILSRSESYNKFTGSISYTYVFPLNDLIDDDNVVSEEITIEYQRPKRITAVQIIPGLSSGPIIQDIGTKNEERKTLTVNLVLTDNATEIDAENRFNNLVIENIPSVSPYYLDSDTSSYNKYGKSYQRSISWIYKN